jgi:hypothetical protein
MTMPGGALRENRGSIPTERREVNLSIILKMATNDFLVRTDSKIPNLDLD